MKLTALFLAIPFAAGLYSCAAISPEHGPVKTEDRTISSFTKIKAGGAFEIDYSSGSAAKATLEAPDDILGKVVMEVNNGVLEIRTDGDISGLRQPICVHLTGITLENAEISGASSLDLRTPLNGSSFSLSMEGAAHFRGTVYVKSLGVDLKGASVAEIGGMINELNAETTGASSLSADKLAAVKATVQSSGASNSSLRADSVLDAKASGASSITYSGNPKVLEKEVNGASSISRQ